MKPEEIIQMAREAEMPFYWQSGEVAHLDQLKRFAALVADAEAKRIYNEGMVTVGHMRKQIAAEREACAVIAETPIGGEQDDITMQAKDRVAAAIRARGNT
jgi:tetraacyldisaccharide-1-P 4'-kinase